MKKRRLQLGLALLAGIAGLYYAGAASQAQRANGVNFAAQRALIEEYCVACHNQKARTAGIVLEGLDFNDLLDADHTFLNQRLAEHYGIPGVYGAQMRRVALNEQNRARRGGLLGQASILTVTSYSNRTSVVQRGKWILESLLGAPPPPPPPDVPELKPKNSDGRALEADDAPTVRAIVREAARDDYRLPAIINAIIRSRPFQMRKRSQ